MLVDSEGKQLPINHFIVSSLHVIPRNQYEAMRDFLLSRVMDWIKSKSDSFGVKELVGKSVFGDEYWKKTPLQWLYDYYEEGGTKTNTSSQDEQSDEAFNKARMLSGNVLYAVLADESLQEKFVKERDTTCIPNRNLYRSFRSIPDVE